ncbi:MAG: exodeoxyribonuclease III [Acidimicrobiia bacterium]|nr:exodeoxyribonuclease III [Acidimicrobiia bacterium]
MRLVTWNVNSLKARLERVTAWLEMARPDVVCLQETKMADAAFPHLAFESMGYESAHHGEGRWNGVAILSRVGLDDVHPGFEDDDAPDTDARLLWATCAGVRVASAYVPNGRALDDDHYRYKLEWLARLQRNLEQHYSPEQHLAVCGDFNIAPDDRDVWSTTALEGSTHVSQPERDALAALEAWGLVDVFRRHYDADGLYSWWDYRGGAFHQGRGMRIDLLMVTEVVAAATAAVLIDRNARKGKPTPSDHAPVIADITQGADDG